jgi:hypothetical protein
MNMVRNITWGLAFSVAALFGSSGVWAQEETEVNIQDKDDGSVIIIKQDGEIVKRVQIRDGDDDEKIVVIVDDEDGEQQEIIIDDDDWGDWGESLGESIGEIINSIGQWIGDSGREFGRQFRGFEDSHMARSEAGNTRNYEETRSAYSIGTIKIENIAGKVHLTGWDRQEIKITGVLGEDVRRVDFDVDGDSADIEVVVPDGRRRKVRTDLTIFAPRHSNVEIETVSSSITVKDFDQDSHDIETTSGAVHVENVLGEIDIENVSGSVTVKNADDDVSANSVSGRLHIEGVGLGQVEAETVSGSITVKGVTDELDANTVNGAIHIEAGKLDDVRMEAVNGSITYKGGLTSNGDLNASSLNGSIHLEFDAPVEGRYDLQTYSGKIYCAYGPDIKSKGRSKHVQFDVNDGNASVKVETFNGSITIK